MKKRTTSAMAAALGIISAVVLVAPANAAQRGELPSTETGGWSEDGSVIGGVNGAVGPFANPSHRGAAEEKVISGTSNKRAHGWTTWSGTQHYTTAQLEHYWPNSGVIATSGRKYGTGGTEAISPWKAFNPNATSNGNGIAKTYYGR